ncbi:hypothetical protein [Halorubrum sp. DTA98]|uniref:hypothetical protein n=1 Tax=Halorubrum sp. DTA98 TaxID=3402163 RepID=UPI003AADDD8D
MRRRTLLPALAAAATTGLVGCSRLPPTGDDGPAVADRFDGEPIRPECDVESETIEVTMNDETRTYETATTVPYPDPPTAFDEDALVDWVPAFEEAYVTHDVLCDQRGSGHILRIDYQTDRIEVLGRDGPETVVRLRYAGGATAGLDDGGIWEADLGHSAVAYAIDETGAARVALDASLAPGEEDGESSVPDPVAEGEFVAAFD